MTRLETQLRQENAYLWKLVDQYKRSADVNATPSSELDRNYKSNKMTWQPIETAPKDQRILLAFNGDLVVCGRWCSDKNARSPKPYWLHDAIRWVGVRETRARPPTHWMLLPAQPEVTK